MVTAMENEVWKKSPSLSAYEVSSMGRVRSVPRRAPMPHGGSRIYGGKAWFGTRDEHGRPKILYRGKNYRISRLVAEAFHGPAPFPGAVVMHLNDDPADNRAENLKWGSQKENLNTPRFIAFCKSRTGDNNPYRASRLAKQ